MSSTALEAPSDLAAPPAVAGIDRKKWELVKATVAKDASDHEVAMFLELAEKYSLDPFAKEIWCVKGKSQDGEGGRLLIMVGRDGLRKIAQRNNIHIDGDVVHEHDRFEVLRTPDGNRAVEHAWGRPEDRGVIVGAWAECREGGPLGRPLGFFYAAMSEYKPTSAKKLQYSPWGTQESVMILAAAERQALRQATPLSGLLVEGEAEKRPGEIEAPQEREALLDAIIDHIPLDQQARAKELIDEMNSLAPHSWGAAKVEMVFAHKRGYSVSVELSQIERQIEELRQDSGDDATTTIGETPEIQIEDAELVPERAVNASSHDEPSQEAQEQADILKGREAQLEASYEQCEEGSREQEELGVELDQVQEAIRDLGFTPSVDVSPAQDSLPL
jgi:phage recombination protein Bet